MADSAMSLGQFTHDNTEAPTYTDRVLPLFNLYGRTAIVSGAGAGIGLAVAEALAEAGANVAMWYNTNKKADQEARRIAEVYGVKCMSPSFQAVLSQWPPIRCSAFSSASDSCGQLHS